MRRSGQFERRLSGLNAMVAGQRDYDAQACTAMTQVWEAGKKPPEILIRAGFIKRLPDLTDSELLGHELDDRRRPKLPRRPPLSQLVEKPKGLALTLALMIPFLVQAGPSRPSGRRLAQPVRHADQDEMSLMKLIAMRAIHDHRAVVAGGRMVNHERQLKAALDALAALDVVQLDTAGKGHAKYARIVPLNEAPGDRLVYDLPDPTKTPAVSVPVDFWLKGWIHALTSREIGAWLMFRDLQRQFGPTGPLELDNSVGHGLHISGDDRLRQYDLTRACWDTHAQLEDFGLITHTGDPNRDENGRVTDYADRQTEPERHRFQFTDDGLKVPAVAHVEHQLSTWGDRMTMIFGGLPLEVAFGGLTGGLVRTQQSRQGIEQKS